MKKILCLIDGLGMGGAERQMIGLASFLKEKGYHVDLVTYNSRNLYAEIVEKYGLASITLCTKNNKWSKLQAVRHHIKAVGGYDWVIAYKDGPAVIGCLLKMFGVKFRLIVSERNTNQGLTKRERLKFFLYRWANYIVPNAYAQERFIVKNFPELKNSTITITNFTDTDYFKPIVRDKSNILNILTVARIAKQKNVLNYLEAIKLLKADGYTTQVHFDWYGDIQTGEEFYGELCYKRRLDLELENLITFHLGTTDIVNHYQTCDIFCLPSIYEGFPNVICEAMSCGKPIVCSRVCDNPDIVKENVNGLFFDPTDVQSIYNSLKQMIEMSNESRLEWGYNSRCISESLFSKQVFVDKYIRLIDKE